MSATVAPLTHEAVDTLSSLAAEIWRQHYPPIIGAAQTEYMLAQRYEPRLIRAELERNDIWWDVIYERGTMVAFASCVISDDPSEIKLDKLYVLASRQRHGYGGLLIAHACERAARAGYRNMVLAVNKRNHAAIAAYRKYGFEIREAIVKAIGGGFVMDDYIMQKRLGAASADRADTTAVSARDAPQRYP